MVNVTQQSCKPFARIATIKLYKYIERKEKRNPILFDLISFTILLHISCRICGYKMTILRFFMAQNRGIDIHVVMLCSRTEKEKKIGGGKQTVLYMFNTFCLPFVCQLNIWTIGKYRGQTWVSGREGGEGSRFVC